ncbi:uncharacterized protein [Euphorbia lathyris]|uniref:uncharacterized protein isoform X2 n=1 Tax=Euphorbia lathyris TaxID=212925 RepID=UPI0033141C1D
MAKSADDVEEKLDGLEIISIGSLYSGTWDKKYWSSSRGKDRYPYPVGYQARRAYNGSDYKMEIQEGLKGPLFLINSVDGHSCSGQTPDIAWENFQKKGCPRVKIWHGKRFSCKIDGIEFFGFRNPFVQRLLRELVANVHGIAEQSLLSSNFCNEASNIDHKKKFQDASTCSNLLPYLAGPQVTTRKSKRLEMNANSLNTDGSKKQRRYPTSEQTCENLKYEIGEESSHISVKNDLHLKSVDDPDLLSKRAVPAHEVDKVSVSENNESTNVINNSFVEKGSFDRLQHAEVEGLNFSASSEFKTIDVPLPQDSQNVHDVDLCAPDTLEFEEDNSTNSSPSTLVKNNCGIKEDAILTNQKALEDLVNKSHPEEKTGASNLKSVDDLDLLSKRAVPAHEEDNVAGSENNESPSNIKNSFVEKGSSDRVQHTEVEGLNVSASSELKAIDVSLPQDSQSVHDVDLCAPDTLEFEEDNSTNSAPSTLVKTNCGIKEVILTNAVVSDDLVNKSHPEEETGTSNWNVNSERSDFDSIGQDITKSMMTFLLPQAIPLLKKTSSKKTKAISSSEKFPPATVEKNTEHGFFVETQSPGVDSVVQGTEYTRHITLEKFDSGKLGDHLVNLSASFSSKAEANQSCFGKDEYCPNVGKQFSDIDVKESLDCHAGTSRSKDALDDDKGPCVVGTRDVTVGTVGPALSSMMDTLTEAGASKIKKISSSQVSKKVYTRKKVLNTESTAEKCHPPLVEGVTCRKVLDVHDLDTKRTLLDSQLFQMSSSVDEPHKKEGSVECTGSSLIQPTKCFDNKISSTKDIQGSSEPMMQRDLELDNELEGMVEFLGCYFHPMPVLSLVLRRKGNEIFICVLCGLLVDESRTLFVYKLVIEEPRAGCPLFVGHTLVTWPSSTYVFDKELALERSGLQITPDGQCLVLLGSIRTPHCREGKLNCLCSACKADHFENNAVKIVQIKAGYVSVLSKLETTDSLLCILVFEPDHLIAAGENRRLHLWTMNSRWSAPTEESIIESNDYICPCIVEIKRIPKFDSLVIGHNGFGEFTLWDISKRIFISRFSAPSTSVRQFFPISSFSWQTGNHNFRYSNVEAQINMLMDATKIYFSQHSKNHSFPPLEMEDIGIWFLVSSVCDTDSHHDYVSRDCQTNPAGWWRLALLVKNTLIFGSALDPRAAAIGTSSGEGIIGTHDGLVYMWDLLTGKKLGTLHKFEGGVSCIATDDSGSGVIGVVDDRGQLLVYQCLKRDN